MDDLKLLQGVCVCVSVCCLMGSGIQLPVLNKIKTQENTTIQSVPH